jgi:hypothetical protein
MQPHMKTQTLEVAAAMPAWLQDLHVGPMGHLPRSALHALFRATWGLVGSGQEHQLDQALRMADVSKLPPVAIVGLLRYCARWRGRMPAWPDLLDRSWTELETRGLPVQELLMGLRNHSGTHTPPLQESC